MNQVAPTKRSELPLEANATRSAAEMPARPKGRRAFLVARVVVIVGLIAALVAWGSDWLHTTMAYVHETDARIKADLVQISAEVEGLVVDRPVEEGAAVEAGDVLARIDPRSAELRIAEFEAEKATVAAEIAGMDAEISMIDSRTLSRIASARSRLAEARAAYEVVQHEFSFAESDYKRAESLASSGAISATRLDRSRTDYLKARQELAKARAEIASAEAEVGEAEADRAEIDVKESAKRRLEAQIAEIDARLGQQRIDLEHRTVRAPFAGVVGKTFISAGERVQPGQRLMVMHDPGSIWIETNIRETEIARVEIGQKARIEVDAFPDQPFLGEVYRIGRAATNQFALLPRLNESGTFTKVTQRIEVRIRLDRNDPRLVPGMMVEVFVEAAESPFGSGLSPFGAFAGSSDRAPVAD